MFLGHSVHFSICLFVCMMFSKCYEYILMTSEGLGSEWSMF